MFLQARSFIIRTTNTYNVRLDSDFIDCLQSIVYEFKYQLKRRQTNNVKKHRHDHNRSQKDAITARFRLDIIDMFVTLKYAPVRSRTNRTSVRLNNQASLLDYRKSKWH